MAKKLIYIVDDEEDIVELLKFHLKREGYDVEASLDGTDAVRTIPRKKPDLVLLDRMLPGMDGLEVCRLLKKDDQTSGIPVIMVTAKGEESDIVAGLELGAVDYITKPFSIKVLIARVRTVFRTHSVAAKCDADIVKIHEISINPGRHKVLLRGKPVEMTITEIRILHLLARRPGWVMTRNQIVDAVKGVDYAVTDRSIDVHIVGLRKKMGSCSDYIETVRGVGYRFKE